MSQTSVRSRFDDHFLDRRPAFAGTVYPADPNALRELLDGWVALSDERSARCEQPGTRNTLEQVVGVLSPHIDFERGSKVYADVWRFADTAVRAADLIVVFGTDHRGRAGSVTPTFRNYRTPLGTSPTDIGVVNKLMNALGTGVALAQEPNHLREHSIELALVWIHYLLHGATKPLVPLLIGSFAPFTDGHARAVRFRPFDSVLEALTEATAGKRVLTVIAGDLSHVGPAFGDHQPLDAASKSHLQRTDALILEHLASGSAERLLTGAAESHDATRLCGIPPAYLALRSMGAVAGTLTSYQQCPADTTFGSVVSIAGMVFSVAP